MRRLALLIGCSVAVAAVVVALAAGRNHWRPLLPLRVPARATPSLTAVLSDDSGSRLAQIDPATFARLRASARMTYYEGWVRSPDGRLLAVSTNPDSNDVSYSTLHFATVSSLRRQGRGLRLNGYFDAAIWPRPSVLYALVGDYIGRGLTLDKIDVAARKVVAQTSLQGPVLDIERSANGLVVLEGGKNNAIGPARLLILDVDGAVRSLRLDRILAGTHFDQSAQDPIGTIREPGLAVDPSHAVAYILDPDGLVAAVGLRDRRVTYHRLGHTSLVARLSDWLTPAALAKGANGPMLIAQWLGDGLIALTGNNESTSRHKDGSLDFSIQPAGLRIVDTRHWRVRTLDPRADSVLVADGVLLASGGSSHSDSNGSSNSGEGIAAYNPNGSLRWRLDPGKTAQLVAAYGNRALVQFDTTSGLGPLQLLNLATGHVVRQLPSNNYATLLLGNGSHQP
jgi:hypothetical protein